ncbi:hypothetical protein SAMN05444349_11081 [Bacteroides faecichinchillae]|uniref:Uncharacterized protein n=1 Tax=Bacteroides faecichinchillae TaxID=871325 RepID=A0A1M4YF14_9BACE|nr:hypothetical protein SAMN05444349_11081 [Bacteroides faecichinchillae]
MERNFFTQLYTLLYTIIGTIKYIVVTNLCKFEGMILLFFYIDKLF